MIDNSCGKCCRKEDVQKIVPQECDVMWVGVSLKKCMKIEEALDEASASGSLLRKIEQKNPQFSYYRTNILKCAPIGKNGKLRYPSGFEMENCYPTLLDEIKVTKPKVVFLLGSIVSKFVFSKLNISFYTFAKDYSYSVNEVSGVKYVAIHHPSYINVYKKSSANSYIASVAELTKFCVGVSESLELSQRSTLSFFKEYKKGQNR